MRHHIKGFKRNATVGRLSDIAERPVKKVEYNNATVGRLSDITERAFIHKEIVLIINVQFMIINRLVHPQE